MEAEPKGRATSVPCAQASRDEPFRTGSSTQVVAGARHDYGRSGRLLVCDGTGFYEVFNRREVHRLELPKSGANEMLRHVTA